jgi:hypothetical protein
MSWREDTSSHRCVWLHTLHSARVTFLSRTTLDVGLPFKTYKANEVSRIPLLPSRETPRSTAANYAEAAGKCVKKMISPLPRGLSYSCNGAQTECRTATALNRKYSEWNTLENGWRDGVRLQDTALCEPRTTASRHRQPIWGTKSGAVHRNIWAVETGRCGRRESGWCGLRL